MSSSATMPSAMMTSMREKPLERLCELTFMFGSVGDGKMVKIGCLEWGYSKSISPELSICLILLKTEVRPFCQIRKPPASFGLVGSLRGVSAPGLSWPIWMTNFPSAAGSTSAPSELNSKTKQSFSPVLSPGKMHLPLGEDGMPLRLALKNVFCGRLMPADESLHSFILGWPLLSNSILAVAIPM